MSDSPYDPSPETLARLRDRHAAEAAAKRLADDPELKGAVEKLKEIEHKLEAALHDPAPAPASSDKAYVPDAKPEPVKGRLTVPRVVVKPRKFSGDTTVRALSLTPLVKLGLADVDNDGLGDVKATYRWGKIAMIATPFVLLALYGIVRALGGPSTVTTPPRDGTGAPTSAPPPHAVPAQGPSERQPATEDSGDARESSSVNDRSPTKLSVTATATNRPREETSATPRAKPTAAPSASGWVPEF
jgi:hypothetical protein